MVTSSVQLPGFSSPAVGFEQPFEMLEACHQRVQRSLGLLARIVEHVEHQGHDASSRGACGDVLRYFDLAAPLHHEDEELHVFPLLLAQGAPDVVALVQRLQQDHVQMAADWAAARAPLVALCDGDAQPLGAAGDALDRFASRYAGHIAAEEGAAYPAAAALLAQDALAAMGREMAARRGAPH